MSAKNIPDANVSLPDAAIDATVVPPDAVPPDAVPPDSAPPVDAAPPDARPPDAAGPPDATILVRIEGDINYNGGVAGTITLLPPLSGSTTTPDGPFHFDVPEGSRAIMKAETASLRPMIRGVVARANDRPRTFYILGESDEMAAMSLGLSFDPTKAIVEVDFRGVQTGGYGATMTDGNGNPVQPGFGYAYDSSGNPQQSLTTVSGGDGSTLLFGNIDPGDVTFAPIIPSGALPCVPCDANPLPLQAGVVTWFDFDCKTTPDCQ